MKHFKHEAHERAYKELVEEMYLSDEELRKPSPFLRRQLAFVYLIALYQDVYESYEGEKFYIEAGEELSIGGPTYLFEETISEQSHAHEKSLLLACEILKGIKPDLNQSAKEDVPFFQEAIKIVENNN